MTKQIAIIGGGPAGLIAAEKLAEAGCAVTVYERKPSVGRKFLLAGGQGGLNLTHTEPMPGFAERYGAAAAWMKPFLEAFSPEDLRNWCEGLGVPTFVGTSGRVFPVGMKATPLLRAWAHRLNALGVTFATGSTFRGWNGDALGFERDGTMHEVRADAALFALGGASWPRLGSDGHWVEIFRASGVEVADLKPSNCGFVVPWSAVFQERFAGKPLKPVVLRFDGVERQGEVMITRRGIEGGLVYAFSAALRDAIEREGSALLHLDLRPGVEEAKLAAHVDAQRGGLSFSNLLRSGAGLGAEAAGFVREAFLLEGRALETSGAALAAFIKNCPLKLVATAGIERAISSAGGVKLASLDANLMLRAKPGCFAAGEMLDWEAPTGGYLLQGCFSTGVAAANGILRFLT